MKTVVYAASLVIALTGVVGSANAIGCLSGAAGGAVVGHMAHHHALTGAAVGCIAGHELKMHEKRKKAAELKAEHAVTHPAPAHH
jgi:hypothetical protein